ncbi:UNVERIFIED_CONTAM: hypothetical protein K2H54_049193 [Gekko kuhli]
MQCLGHKRSASECRTKSKALQQDYKTVVGHNQKSGASRITCPFFEQLDRIMWKDRSAPPPQIKPSLKARYKRLPMITVAEPAPGSEELFSQDPDLLTINHEDLITSTPTDHQEGESILGSQLQDRDGHGEEDESSTGRCTEDGLELIKGAGTMENEILDEPEAGSADHRDKDGGQPGLLPQKSAKKTAEERFAELKNRQRRVALLSDIAEKMLVQGQEDQREAMKRDNGWKEMEERRFRAMMEEGERDRQAIHRNATIMQAAVDALNHMGDIFTGMQDRPMSTPRSQNPRKRVLKQSVTPGRDNSESEHGASSGDLNHEKADPSGSQSLLSTVTPSLTQSGGECRSSKRVRAPKKYFSFGD